jgi:hypothetical protein
MRLMKSVRESMLEGLITPEEYKDLTQVFMRVIDAPQIPRRRQTNPDSLTQRYVKALKELPPGKALLVGTWKEQCLISEAARRHGLKVVTRKISGEGIAVWRVET